MFYSSIDPLHWSPVGVQILSHFSFSEAFYFRLRKDGWGIGTPYNHVNPPFQYSFIENLVDARMLEHITKKEYTKYLKVVDSFHR